MRPGAAIIQRKVRSTGTLVTVGHADTLGLDDCGGDCAWYTVCEEHNEIVGHRTKALALHFMPVPAEWCDACREDADLASDDEPDTSSSRLLMECYECRRVFDLSLTHEAAEWHYGHDCEAES